MARFLLFDCHVDPAGTDGRGQTPLHIAAAAGLMDMLQLLLEAGSPIGALDTGIQSGNRLARLRWGSAPLHYAVANNHLEIAANLLLCGADPNVQDVPNGYTPLHLAAKNDHALLIALLVGNRGLLHFHEGEPMNPVPAPLTLDIDDLERQVSKNKDRLRAIAQERREKNARIEARGGTPLVIEMACSGRESSVEEINTLLLRSESWHDTMDNAGHANTANVHLLDNAGNTALQLAILSGSAVAAQLLARATTCDSQDQLEIRRHLYRRNKNGESAEDMERRLLHWPPGFLKKWISVPP